MPKSTQIPVAPRAYSMRQAKAATSLGKTSLYKLMRDGTLPFVLVGTRRLILADGVDRLLSGGAS
jgi:excisionase family DNA binding protein